MVKRHTLKEALAIIEGAIAEAHRSGTNRLPSVRMLSRQSALSQTLLLRAIHECVDRGALETRPGSGTFLVGTAAPRLREQAPPSRRRRLFERIAMELIADVHKCRFGSEGKLPGIGNLSNTYGVNYRTMRRALAFLVEKGFISSIGHTGQTSTVAKHNEPLVVICFVRIVYRNKPSPQVQGDVMVLQQLCRRFNLRLEFIRLRYVGLKVRIINDAEAEKLRRISRQRVLGIIVLMSGIHEVEDPEIVLLANSFQQPIVLLDDYGDMAALQGFSMLKGLSLFRLRSSRYPGIAVGTYLLNHGHRRVAYVRFKSDQQWSLNRLEGVREVYGHAVSGGQGHPVVVVEGEQESARTWHEAAITRLVADTYRALPRDILDEAMGGLVAEVRQAGKIKGIEKSLHQRLGRLSDGTMPQAWICETDAIAVQCVRFCETHGLRVPQDISVVGFDDSFEAFTNSITSYNFNRESQLSMVFDYLFRRARRAPKQEASIHTAVERVGYITERGSVAHVSGPVGGETVSSWAVPPRD